MIGELEKDNEAQYSCVYDLGDFSFRGGRQYDQSGALEETCGKARSGTFDPEVLSLSSEGEKPKARIQGNARAMNNDQKQPIIERLRALALQAHEAIDELKKSNYGDVRELLDECRSDLEKIEELLSEES